MHGRIWFCCVLSMASQENLGSIIFEGNVLYMCPRCQPSHVVVGMTRCS